MEEPNQDTLFILETHTLETILPTIKSRCWIVHFQPISTDNVKNYLIKKFGDPFDRDDYNRILHKFNGENLCDVIEIALKLNRQNGQTGNNQSEALLTALGIDFLELFRKIYRKKFYEAYNILDQVDIPNNRELFIKFLDEMLNFCYLVLKTRISTENKESDLIKLAAVVDKRSFNELIRFIVSSRNWIENYINQNLVLIRLMLLINNSFIKK